MPQIIINTTIDMEQSIKKIKSLTPTEATKEEFVDSILMSYPSKVIATALVEVLMENKAFQSIKEPQPIVVTPEEYERITSLFRPKGMKLSPEGDYVNETRGRKPRPNSLSIELERLRRLESSK